MSDPIEQVQRPGQSVWYDDIRCGLRPLLPSVESTVADLHNGTSLDVSDVGITRSAEIRKLADELA